MISYGRQTIEEDDVRAVAEALTSDMLTQGPKAAEFEEALASYTGARYAVCCSNGTAALHLACLAAGIGEGSGVVTSPVTFLASANAALYVGARPAFADIDPETLNIDPACIEKRVKADPGVKAVIPVHFAGLPCDMEEIRRIAAENRLVVIEDACHALGASYRAKGRDGKDVWRKIGSCAHSDMTVFSFHPVKSITTGEGGAITTDDRALYERLKLLRSHGVTKEPSAFIGGGEAGPWHYEMHELGFNFRLSDVQSALGISQMKKLDRFIERRAEIAGLYSSLFARYPFIKAPVEVDGRKSAFHLYPVRIAFSELGVSRKECFELMRAIGISLQVHYIPVHLQPYYMRRFGFKAGDFPEAERFYAEEISLPIYPQLTDEDAGDVVEALVSTIAHAAASGARGATRPRASACVATP